MARLLSLVVVFLAWNAWGANFEVVDIGFRDLDKHIAIDLNIENGVDTLKFRLASNVTGKSVPVSDCSYPQTLLEGEVAQIQDPAVKADYRWIFLRSDYSSSPSDLFFAEFKALLERAKPDCPVHDLQHLKDQLNVRGG